MSGTPPAAAGAAGAFYALDAGAADHAALCAGFRWQVPEHFNIGRDVCGRWADERNRFALYYEDEAGFTERYSFWDIRQAANRLSNALAALGLQRGERFAIVLPQRPECAIAHVAAYQLGAVAVPLSHLFGPDALEYRLGHADVRIALVDESTWPKLEAVRARLPRLQHVIGTDSLATPGVLAWSELLAAASPRFEPIETRADDPALIIYTSGTTGQPKGAVMPQRALIGNLPGFVCSHDFFPQRRDMFWSPADWAWTGGLFDALLPTWHFGMPILAYRGRFTPEKAFALIEKYGVRNAFLFPTALKQMMKAVPEPRARYDVELRTLMSGGEPVGETVFRWAQEQLGVTINEIFGQTEMNYVVGGCAGKWPPKPGAMGKAYPGHQVAVIDDAGDEVPSGEVGEVAVNRRCNGQPDPVMLLEYLGNAEATAGKFTPQGWGRTGDLARQDADGYFWYQGRADDMFKSGGYRIGPSEIENCLLKHPAVANAAVVGVPDAERGAIVKACVVLQPGFTGDAALVDALQQHVRRTLAPYEVPKEIEFLAALPMTTTGKVMRRVLRSAATPSGGAKSA